MPTQSTGIPPAPAVCRRHGHTRGRDGKCIVCDVERDSDGRRSLHGSGEWSLSECRYLPTHPGIGVCPTCGSDLTVLKSRRNVRAANPALWCWKETRTLSTSERRQARADVQARGWL